MPMELRDCVHKEVEATRQRSGWPAGRTLSALGVSRSSYYRWRRAVGEQSPPGAAASQSPGSGSVYEVLDREREAVVVYARSHPEIRHRELSWRMVDEDVACVSSSTVYRVLRDANLICRWRSRTKRYREECEKASRPDQRWATDILYLRVGGGRYYLIAFVDEYSRYIVHWELLLSMDGATLSLAAQTAVETLGRNEEGKPLRHPEIRSDNGSGYVSADFRAVLRENDLAHLRIHPYCPEENGLVERANRTLREALDAEALETPAQSREVVRRIVRWYNEERLHSAINYLRPIDYYRGDPKALMDARRVKLAQARHQRREENLKLRQLTLPVREELPVA